MWELEARNRVQVQKPKEGKLIGSLSHTAGLFVKPYLFNHQQSATHGNSVLARRDNSLRFCRGCSCVWRECVCFSHVPTSFYAQHRFLSHVAFSSLPTARKHTIWFSFSLVTLFIPLNEKKTKKKTDYLNLNAWIICIIYAFFFNLIWQELHRFHFLTAVDEETRFVPTSVVSPHVRKKKEIFNL